MLHTGTREVEHRCDCGRLFSSAALLSRHTSLAHTPSRILRRRDVSPLAKPQPLATPRHAKSLAKLSHTTPSHAKSLAKPSQAKSLSATTQPATSTKSRPKSEASGSKPGTSVPTPKSNKRSGTTSVTAVPGSASKTKRYAAHSGVPVPEKMRKMMEKMNSNRLFE